jgi:hypothetical protein
MNASSALTTQDEMSEMISALAQASRRECADINRIFHLKLD